MRGETGKGKKSGEENEKNGAGKREETNIRGPRRGDWRICVSIDVECRRDQHVSDTGRHGPGHIGEIPVSWGGTP